MKRIVILVATLLLVLPAVAATLVAQDGQRTLTNADVLNMAKSGMGEKTIILAIRQGPTKFDTSPEALIELKQGGVSDDVLNAVLVAAPNAPVTSSTDVASREGLQLLAKALNAIGTSEQLASVHAYRLKLVRTQSTASGTASFQMERTVVFPDKVYMTSQASNGLAGKLVVTPEHNYQISGQMVAAPPAPLLEDIRSGIKNESAYIAQHLSEYTCLSEGSEQIGEVTTLTLRIRGPGRKVQWDIDPATGRLLRSRATISAGEVVTDYSDWRLVDGVYVAFMRHSVENGHTYDTTVTSYELNPAIDASMFAPPAQQVTNAFTFKVLQSESTPYVVETGGGVSTNCQISGSTSTTISAYTSGNITTGSATSTPDLRMNCNSSQNSFKWKHVLNAMLVEASDGNAYVIGCDRAWRWSKCTPLAARWTL